MKFSRRRTEPTEPRPRRAAEVLDPHVGEDASVDIRHEIAFRLKQKWDAYVMDLYAQCAEGKAEKSDLYHCTALLRQLTKNAGSEWLPPEEWKQAFTNRARKCSKEMDKSFGTTLGITSRDGTEYGHPDIELQGIFQTFPEVRTDVPVTTQGIMALSKVIKGGLRESKKLVEMVLLREYAMVVLQPKNAKFVRGKNSEAGFTPQALFEKIGQKVTVPAFFLAYLRLLYPNKQEDILKLWTRSIQQETEEGFSDSTAHASVEMKYAFALMVLQAQDARLVDGQVVLQFAPPTLRRQTPIPPRSHV